MRKYLSLVILLVALSTIVNGQKSLSRAMTISYSINSTSSIPQQLKKYRSELITPLEPLSPDDEMQATLGVSDKDREAALSKARTAKILELEKSFLSIQGSQFNPVSSGEDFTISLVTSDVKVTFINPIPINDLKLEDDLFRYIYSGVLTVKDKEGNVILQKALANPEVEQTMTKAVVFFNPTFRVKANLYKNNPEKLKKITDRMLEKKNHLVLNEVLNMADREIANSFETQFKSTIVGIFSVKGKEFEETEKASDNLFDTYMKFNAFSKKNRIPKEKMDEAWRSLLITCDKYLTEKKGVMEEKASQGLSLNCAMANIWLGDYEKAAVYLESVPDTKEGAQRVEDIQESSPDAPGTILAFKSYAINAQELSLIFKEYKERITITQ